MALGDYFSSGAKQILADGHLKVGNVVKCFIRETNPPKEKRFIILGRTANGTYLGVVFINSNINFKVINSQVLLELQLPLKGSDHDFLDHDSFVDCSKLTRLDLEDTRDKIASKPGNVLGKINDHDLESIKTLVRQSPNVTPKELKSIEL